MDKPIEIVRVPVTYEEKARKVPFLLFVGWTTEERREFAKALRELKSKTEEGVKLNLQSYQYLPRRCETSQKV